MSQIHSKVLILPRNRHVAVNVGTRTLNTVLLVKSHEKDGEPLEAHRTPVTVKCMI